MSLADLLDPPVTNNGELVTTLSAASILGISRKQVLIRIQSGLLATEHGPRNSYFLHLDEVLLAKKAEEALERLAHCIQEMYMLHREGATLDYLVNVFKEDLDHLQIKDVKAEINSAIALYTYQREAFLRTAHHGVAEEKRSDAITGSELMARLRTLSWTSLTHIKKRELVELIPGKYDEMLFSYQSFERYIGKLKANRIYKTDDAVRYFKENGEYASLAIICRISLKNRVGRKIYSRPEEPHKDVLPPSYAGKAR